MDWYNWTLGPMDASFAGIAPWTPEGLSGQITFTYTKEKVATRVQRAPYNDAVESVLAADNSITTTSTPSTPSTASAGSGDSRLFRGEYEYSAAGADRVFTEYSGRNSLFPVVSKWPPPVSKSLLRGEAGFPRAAGRAEAAAAAADAGRGRGALPQSACLSLASPPP
jgi:hypothetical protein